MPPAQHLSPSRRDGMSAHDEKQRRRKTCFFIDECGVRLQLPKLPVMTAQCFFHKFFARESFRRHDRFVVAQACLFLAAKVEESAVSLRSLVRECHGVRYAGKSRAPLDESSERDVKRASSWRSARCSTRAAASPLSPFAPRRRVTVASMACRGDGVRSGSTPLHAIDAACRWRAARRGTARRRREGGEEHTHTSKRE